MSRILHENGYRESFCSPGNSSHAQMISGKIRRAGMLPESVAEVLAVAPGSLLRETPFKKIEGRHDSDDARI
ncbi:MAG: hypothetical protein IPF49_07145 [Gammaproteobacteria bacterium]|nr:hypothetical protein [Gammaproteobacteria bacterium]